MGRKRVGELDLTEVKDITDKVHGRFSVGLKEEVGKKRTDQSVVQNV